MSKAEITTSTPRRSCVGCRRRASPDDLYRCALTAEGVAIVSRTAPGRGAWLCGEECLVAAVRHRRFGRAWRRPVPDDLEDRLRAALAAAREQRRSRSTEFDGDRRGIEGLDDGGTGAVAARR